MECNIIKAPNKIEGLDEFGITIFLGGSIEMGAAENWQDRLCKHFGNNEKLFFLNPRRDDWDSSWEQIPEEGTQFYEQVSWELEHQDVSDIIVYYFDPNTKSPITLLELGSYGSLNPEKVIVCCPDGFWRKGNVVMFCNHHGIQMCNTFEEFTSVVETHIYCLTK
jgi:hypothetical protein